MNRILLTGAAGVVGHVLRPLLQEYASSVRLSDLRSIEERQPHEEFIRCDVSDLAAVCDLCEGVDAVIHLAGVVGPDFAFDETLSANIVGTYNIFEAARRAGVKRVVYASSHHAVGFYDREAAIDHQVPPRPDSYYGLSKAFGESVACYYADKYGFDVLVIRVGFVGEKAIDERRVHTWISPRDLMQLVAIGLQRTNLGYQLVYGTSNNPHPFFDNANAARLGYRPQDSSTDYLAQADLLHVKPDRKRIEDRCIGGDFVVRRAELNE